MYDATSLSSVSGLSNKLLRAKYLTKGAAAGVAAALVVNDLMRGPWWFQILARLIKIRGNYEFRMKFFYAQVPDLAHSLIDDAALHMRSGKGTEDKNSVGGFSQREINLIEDILVVNGVK